VLTVPPQGAVARENFCRAEETHVWRTPSEGASPDLAGADKYAEQVPLSRAVPLWGGAGPGGFGAVLWPAERKMTSQDWADVVDEGKLMDALLSVNPGKTNGPWRVLCDNETFLRAPPSRDAHRRCGVTLWKLPARSPDLNPVEKFWAWTRKRLRAMDLRDLVAKRPAASRAVFKQRVRDLFRTAKSRSVASACTLGLRKVATEVVRKNGAASRG
jgi:hypothetical protein